MAAVPLTSTRSCCARPPEKKVANMLPKKGNTFRKNMKTEFNYCSISCYIKRDVFMKSTICFEFNNFMFHKISVKV